MKLLVKAILLTLFATQAFCQGDELLAFEKKIEAAVVAADIPFLTHAYADDFRFKHGTGLVDSKTSWLNTVTKNKGQYLSRVVDSVEVEIHDNIGITNGNITVTRKSDQLTKKYKVTYVRVYIRKKDQWQLIMHRTVDEVDY